MRCPRCNSTILPPATSCGCAAASAPTGGDAPPPVPLSSPDDFVGRMVPSGNKPALIAYYVALGSLLPALGAVFGVVAVIFGIKGVRLEKEHPGVRGGLHAWFGILFGGFFTLVWIVAGVWLIVAAGGGPKR